MNGKTLHCDKWLHSQIYFFLMIAGNLSSKELNSTLLNTSLFFCLRILSTLSQMFSESFGALSVSSVPSLFITKHNPNVYNPAPSLDFNDMQTHG